MNGKIKDINIEPKYDTSKITIVSNEMINEFIDPVTMFYLITNYNHVRNCNFTLNIYDGKRRYDLILSDPIKDNKSFICTITHKKIAGYKIEKIEKDEKYISDLRFKVNSNGKYIFQEVSLRDNNLDLIIKKTNIHLVLISILQFHVQSPLNDIIITCFQYFFIQINFIKNSNHII